jgi:hypothetical protein
MVGRLLFAARSGEDAATSRSDGWIDDILHRNLIPWFKDAIAPERTDERLASGAAVSVIDYSGGVGDQLRTYIVRSVEGVWDLTVDPAMESPLPGTWDPGPKTFTLDAPIPMGNAYAVRFGYEPRVVFTANRHYFDAVLPQIVIEEFAEVAAIGGVGHALVRNKAAGTALRIAGPTMRRYRARVLMQNDGAIAAFDLAESIRRAAGTGHGFTAVSSGTGVPYSVHGFTTLLPARGDQDVRAIGRFDLVVSTSQYPANATPTFLLLSGGFTPRVGTDLTIQEPMEG